ncbi:CKLF-like MARVEL transmembrane domain-containing protein 6 [Melanotaenia boesemani]|uniref:CKLF-like MARVEL transmembrane domain-containing protein 6 n=1 Tax=Melanotaenia boesemani TaxID=1250792 RepID=UPI001C04A263|nr:CKLF-like MARVEL transmembrane domain-containing protein 6 [Melanotaenia boesemani]
MTDNECLTGSCPSSTRIGRYTSWIRIGWPMTSPMRLLSLIIHFIRGSCGQRDTARQTGSVVKLVGCGSYPVWVLSFLAFILEEVVANCISCKALYFFEFVSCTAFLFTLLLLILLSTKLHTKVGISCWAKLDFIYTAAIAVLFLISSIIFAVNNTGSGLESSSVAFGFLAMAAFAVDVFFFVKTRGFPFKKDEQPVSRNGGPVTVETPEETDKLNSVSNGAD